jgi:uncharacterized damage-inducible protein DinB
MKIYDSLYQRLQTQYKALIPIIDHVSDEKLLTNPAPGKWSIHDQIAHLARYQVIFIGRMQQILDTPGVQFGAYKGDEDSEFPAYQLTSLNDLLRGYDVNRAKILALLNGLSDEELALTGVHSRYGTLNITQWAEFFVLHEAHHLFSIFQLANSN